MKFGAMTKSGEGVESDIKSERIKIREMTCINCQNRIERGLRKAPGMKRVKVGYAAGTVDIMYDASVVSMKDVIAAIEKLKYKTLAGNAKSKASYVGDCDQFSSATT